LIFTRFKIPAGILLFVFFFVTAASGFAQQTGSEVDTLTTSFPPENPGADSVSFKPYESNKNFIQHVLSTPSYVFHKITRPFGYIIPFATDKLPEILPLRIKNFSISPWLEFGGENPITFAVSANNNNFLNSGNTMNIEFNISSAEANNFDVTYTLPGTFSEGDKLSFRGHFKRDPSQNFFPGNDTPEDFERLHDETIAETDITYTFPSSDNLSYKLNIGFTNTTIGQGDIDNLDAVPGDFLGRDIDEFLVIDEDTVLLFPQELKGTFRIADINAGIDLDYTEKSDRKSSGARLKGDFGFGHSVNSDDYSFASYRLEYNQFLPVYFLPRTRRLALRIVLDRYEELGGGDIPFFRQPFLGNPKTLRGFRNRRFRDDGALFYTLEYRYFIWDFLDGVLFIDQGQVFDNYNDLALDDINTNYGLGLHVVGSGGTAVRWEFAFGDEGNRTVLVFAKNF